MPLGEIKLRELTAREKQWRAKWDKLANQEMLPHLWRMSRAEYCAFVYALDPREALILSNDRRFSYVREYQLTKRWYHEWRDTVCRFLKR